MRADHGQIMRLRDVLACDEPRAHAGESIGALVSTRIRHPGVDVLGRRGIVIDRMDGPIMERILAAHGRRGNVVMNGVAKYVVIRVRGFDVFCTLAYDDRELGLRMGSAIFGQANDLSAMANERAGRLDEHGGVFWPGHYAL